MNIVTATECGALIGDVADLMVRAAAKQARRGDKRYPVDLALNNLDECWRPAEQQHSWNDLAAYCRVRGKDNAIVRLANVVVAGHLPDDVAWRMLKHSLFGFQPDIIAAFLGAPTPDWWRDQHGTEIPPWHRLTPRDEETDQELGVSDSDANGQKSPQFHQPANGIFQLETIGSRPSGVQTTPAERPYPSIIGIMKRGQDNHQTPPVKQYEALTTTRRRLTRATRTESNAPLTAKITDYGALLFSLSAVQRFGLSHFASCRLHYATSDTSIGIKFLPGKPAKPSTAAGDGARDRSVRRVYTTTNSAHIMVTNLLGTYGIRVAPGIECPVTLTQDVRGTKLVSVDLAPAIEAAARGNAEPPRRPRAKPRPREGAVPSTPASPHHSI